MSETHYLKYFLNFLVKSSKLFFDFGFIIFPSAGFIAQYLKIKSLKNSQGFSKFISFALIMAYIFRIYFWLGKKFEIILLFQSIFGIFVQLILLEICVRYTKRPNFDSINNNKSSNNVNYPQKVVNVNIVDNKDLQRENNNNNSNQIMFPELENLEYFSIKNFWTWNLFRDYVNFLFIFVIILGIITHFFEDEGIFYFEILGLFSAFLEAIIGFPQIIENFKYKSTKTLSSVLILTWILGDSIKLVYFLIIDTPIQLIVCAITQICEDLIIICQIYYYRNNKLIEVGY